MEAKIIIVAFLLKQIICWDLNHQTCEQTADLARSRGVEAWSFQCDVSNQAQVAKVTEQTRYERLKVEVYISKTLCIAEPK